MLMQSALSCPSISELPDDLVLDGRVKSQVIPISSGTGSLSHLPKFSRVWSPPPSGGNDGGGTLGTWGSMSQLPTQPTPNHDMMNQTESSGNEDFVSYMCRNFADDPSLNLFKGFLHLRDFSGTRKLMRNASGASVDLPTPPNSPMTAYRNAQGFTWPSVPEPRSIISRKASSSGEKKEVTFNSRVVDLEALAIESRSVGSSLDSWTTGIEDEFMIPITTAQHVLQRITFDEDGVDEAYGTMSAPDLVTHSPVQSVMFNQPRPSTPGSMTEHPSHAPSRQIVSSLQGYPGPQKIRTSDATQLVLPQEATIPIPGTQAKSKLPHVRTTNGLCSCQVLLQERLHQRRKRNKLMSIHQINGRLQEILYDTEKVMLL
ncbi:uncharacterized protein LOC131893003 isoform X3 [Tigriopus californicus]|nr:uncharacterized protein LOC131893003 isoform X3 [Tigriopus californicus]XP_059098893.1 uncharacterized protein LOC131893003 isoform X3 [Tigriopus californicus]